MQTYIRYTKAASDGAGRYYVIAQERSGSNASTSIVQFSAQGCGESPEAAKKDALRALGSAKATTQNDIIHHRDPNGTC